MPTLRTLLARGRIRPLPAKITLDQQLWQFVSERLRDPGQKMRCSAFSYR
jgi:hypothetical protein